MIYYIQEIVRNIFRLNPEHQLIKNRAMAHGFSLMMSFMEK